MWAPVAVMLWWRVVLGAPNLPTAPPKDDQKSA